MNFGVACQSVARLRIIPVRSAESHLQPVVLPETVVKMTGIRIVNAENTNCSLPSRPRNWKTLPWSRHE